MAGVDENSTGRSRLQGKIGEMKFPDSDELTKFAIIKKTSQENGDYKDYKDYKEYKDADEILKSLMKEWDLKTPKVLISVTGGAKSFDLITHKRTIFRKEIIKLARTIDMWVVSGGSDCGIMKEVGEAVRDADYLTANSVVALEIATFGVVAYRNGLEEANEGEVYCIPEETNSNENETCLDPNHTHFILVDDGTSQQFGKEISVRAEIEKAVSMLKTAETEAMVPVVLLVVEGGPNTIKTVKEAVDNDISIVLIKGSGKAADVLASACDSAEKAAAESESSHSQKRSKKRRRRRSPSSSSDSRPTSPSDSDSLRWIEDIKNLTDDIEERRAAKAAVLACIKKRHLIKIFDMTDTSNMPIDMSEVILMALTDVKNESKLSQQLKLALYWNRIDTARDIMRNISGENLKTVFDDEGMITSALMLDRFAFMEIFLLKGKDMTSYLTKDRLEDLYLEIPSDGVLRMILWETKITNSKTDSIDLDKIGKVITHLVGKIDGVDLLYKNKDILKLENSFLHLFLWCILSNRLAMAKLFWKYGKNQIAAALYAYGLLKKMALSIDDKDLEASWNTNADEFCQLAETMLSKCKESNKQKTMDMLKIKMEDLGNPTCRQIALVTENMSFVAHPFFQSVLSEEWMGKLCLRNRWTWLKIALCVIPPMQLLIPCLIRFTDDDETQNKASTSTSSFGRSNCNSSGMCYCEKIKHFYKAPVVTFIGNSMIYVAFLMLFAFTLLSRFDKNVTAFEVALVVCVFVLFLDEIVQVWASSPGTYFRYQWNYFDIFGIILFVLGFCLFLLEPTLVPSGFGRMVCSLSFISLCLSLIGLFAFYKKIGPQLQMIKKMFSDLLSFLAILSVCVITYAIAAYVNLYPASRIDGDLVFNLLRIPYWNMYGELNLDILELKEPDCTFDPFLYENGTLPRCPTAIGTYLVPLLMGIYMMFASILLLNLLIAMFSNSYAKVQAETHLHWCYQRFRLINECSKRPSFCWPFNLTSKLFKMIRNRQDTPTDQVNDKKYNNLVLWEKAVANEYMHGIHNLS